MKLKNIFTSVVFASAAILAPTVVLAAEGSAADVLDFSKITEGFSIGAVVTGVMAIAAALMGLHLAIKGVRVIMTLVRGG
ncbi:hypothetical protein [Pectobacterium aquaticum]|uniref:Phage-related membrane protein n=1 Tax=Pectobacterium aquaticum TaxID=2204145 RepID=A0AA93AK10_9GAMM|nr:hypothetical protein [Pectobacterium aquaticum]RRO16562.1 hypothetical protein DMB84_014975 [Pectobacterium aquaticum]